MADESVKFKIDFDVKDGLSQVEKLQETLESIGRVESFGNLISSMKNFLGPLALVAAAIYTIKKAMDIAMEGENVKRVELQFNSLAESVGIVGEKLKESIEKAKGPTVDLDDALKASTEAMVKLGLNADRIPEIFELARKVEIGRAHV